MGAQTKAFLSDPRQPEFDSFPFQYALTLPNLLPKGLHCQSQWRFAQNFGQTRSPRNQRMLLMCVI